MRKENTVIPTETGKKSRAQILNEAADLIEKKGWTKGGAGMPHNKEAWASPVKGFCILGAVAEVIGARADSSAYAKAGAVINPDVKDPNLYWTWNDDLPSRIGRERAPSAVVRCLRLLAKGRDWSVATAMAMKTK